MFNLIKILHLYFFYFLHSIFLVIHFHFIWQKYLTETYRKFLKRKNTPWPMTANNNKNRCGETEVWFCFICKGKVLTKILTQRLSKLLGGFIFFNFLPPSLPGLLISVGNLLGHWFDWTIILFLWAWIKQILYFLFCSL